MSAIAALTNLLHAESLSLNDIQVIGSHNSYHKAPPEAVMDVITKFNKNAAEWNYTHPSLTEQLEKYGIRQFEFDIYADPDGGLYASPLAVKLASLARKEIPAFDPEGLLKKPGFKMLHVPDIDCWSTTPTLTLALEELSNWSKANPNHLPVMVLVECKDQAHPPLPTRPLPFTREVLLELEKEILNIIPPSRILRPDDVRKGEKSLPDSLKKHGWPSVESLRGKFIFTLDNTNKVRDHYLDTNPALEERLMFASASSVDEAYAAWFKRNDPVREFDDIQALVKSGFIVRTRADTGAENPLMREKAIASGAQWVSADHITAEGKAPPLYFEGNKRIRTNPLIGKSRDISESP